MLWLLHVTSAYLMVMVVHVKPTWKPRSFQCSFHGGEPMNSKGWNVSKSRIWRKGCGFGHFRTIFFCVWLSVTQSLQIPSRTRRAVEILSSIASPGRYHVFHSTTKPTSELRAMTGTAKWNWTGQQMATADSGPCSASGIRCNTVLGICSCKWN